MNTLFQSAALIAVIGFAGSAFSQETTSHEYVGDANIESSSSVESTPIALPETMLPGEHSDSLLPGRWYDNSELIGQATSCSDQSMECGYQPAEPGWEVEFGVPGWLFEIHGSTTIRNRTAPVNVTTRDALRSIGDINNFYLGNLKAKRGRWGLFAEGMYVDLAVGSQITPRVNLTSGFDLTIVDFGVTYDLSEDLFPNLPANWETSFVLGGRYNRLAASPGLTITGPLGGTTTIARSGNVDWLDPVIGGKLRAPIQEDILLSVKADIGGFGIGSASELTWNIEAMVEFQCTESMRLELGYRVLDIDQRRGSGATRFVYDVQMRGPMARVIFEF